MADSKECTALVGLIHAHEIAFMSLLRAIRDDLSGRALLDAIASDMETSIAGSEAKSPFETPSTFVMRRALADLAQSVRDLDAGAER